MEPPRCACLPSSVTGLYLPPMQQNLSCWIAMQSRDDEYDDGDGDDGDDDDDAIAYAIGVYTL